VILSQEAYTRFVPELKDGGTLIIKQDLVRLTELKPNTKVHSIPATRFAEELGETPGSEFPDGVFFQLRNATT